MLYTMGKRQPFASFTPTAPHGRLIVLYVFGINFDKIHPKIQKNRKKCHFFRKKLVQFIFLYYLCTEIKASPYFPVGIRATYEWLIFII